MMRDRVGVYSDMPTAGVAGEDGVVHVSREKAEHILKKGQEIHAQESKWTSFIKKFKSLRKAIQTFNRIWWR